MSFPRGRTSRSRLAVRGLVAGCIVWSLCFPGEALAQARSQRHNGKLVKCKGYCTDVFFDAALRFIERNKGHPFFAYIPTNAPHAPFNVAEKYSKPYADQGVPPPRAAFYGMIANIDENVGRLL